MTPIPRYQYDEFRQVGKDYADAGEAAVYDETHARFRDFEAESAEILDAVALHPNDVLVDIGAGTGTLAVEAARRGFRVYAVDVSEAMLALARAKAEAAGVADSVTFAHAGFLTYQHAGPGADAVVSMLALHHLPDFWKAIALARIHAALKPRGRFLLVDVVVADDGAIGHVEAFVARQEAAGGDFLREDVEQHFREEYSTFDWVMRGLLERAGFAIERSGLEDGVIGRYLCAKSP
jgi:cyclopropane fatty-acyl-phospholipid synthase-like methyltransferase